MGYKGKAKPDPYYDEEADKLRELEAEIARLRAENERQGRLLGCFCYCGLPMEPCDGWNLWGLCSMAYKAPEDSVDRLHYELAQAREDVRAATGVTLSVRRIAPYVRATLPRMYGEGTEWGKAHLGRSESSIRQLTKLDAEAAEYLARPSVRAALEESDADEER